MTLSLDDVARILIVLAIVNFTLTSHQVWLALKNRGMPVFEERATASVILCAIAIGAGLIGGIQLNIVDMGDGWIGILGLILALATAPILIWEGAYWLGRFSKSGTEKEAPAEPPYGGEGDH